MTASLQPTKPLQICLFSERKNETVPGRRVSNAGRRQFCRRHTEGRTLSRDPPSPTLSHRCVCEPVLFSSESRQNTWPTDFWNSVFPSWDHKGQLSSVSHGGWRFAVSNYMCEPLPCVWMGDYWVGRCRIPERHGQPPSNRAPL